ncbi:4'-phosphopantetheinyl transferase family protein [Brachybacterium squillarum]|uniref:4'-phosphopantetheinyl transferase family protein n=1 Tax=Brachybacterium squillarum TaxID=661979 RepID=UPI002221DDF1|nr:4'-phosphopantetheinyl transferase superfamily protein [Brachybacterium squillarum]MCW1804330.1 4'-phosphopantetheinyl transferase superfamily protein [Brachybacterium squillarum]
MATDADRALRAQVAALLSGGGVDGRAGDGGRAGAAGRSGDGGVEVDPRAGDDTSDSEGTAVEVTAADVRTGRMCPACGSSVHGRPWARVPGHDGEIGVSLSRSGPHLLTAVRLGGGVGADVESIAAVDAGWDPGLVLAPGEEHLARTPEARARLWAGKEAVLKLLGAGLRTPMSEVRLADFDVRPVASPPGFVAAVALP